jgi:hypothetical protein
VAIIVIIIIIQFLLFVSPANSYRVAVIGNYIPDKHNIRSRINYRSTIMQKKQTNKGRYVTIIANRISGLRNTNITIVIVIIQPI